ncbi:hypothetical protein EASAB2608_00834 [Streptomyces sp. EAS-AB2608]|nr:hypothetical protein EASAB2608_00834 [Streptomyces sp. EAS-AB2608]
MNELRMSCSVSDLMGSPSGFSVMNGAMNLDPLGSWLSYLARGRGTSGFPRGRPATGPPRSRAESGGAAAAAG